MVAFVTPNTLAATFTQLQGSAPADISTIRNTMNSISVCNTISALRTLTSVTYSLNEINVAYYAVPNDCGGGKYILNSADTTSADNNGTIIVDASGRRWYLAHNGKVSADSFGIDFSGTNDVSARMQQFFDWCQDNHVIPELHGQGKYKILTGLTLKHGRSSSDTFEYPTFLYGNNAWLISYGGITTLSIVPRCLAVDYTSGRMTANIIIKELVIDGFNANSSGVALKFGAQNYCAYPNAFGSIEDILVQSFPNGNILTVLQDFSHVIFNRFVQKAAGTLLITSTNTSGLTFCGDLVFNECQFDGNAAHPPVKLTCGQTGVTGTNNVRGIKFNTCDIYGTGTILDVRGNGGVQVGDIWFNAVQFDAGGNFGPAAAGETALLMQSSDTASMFQVHINDCYWAGYNGPALLVVQNGSSFIKMSDINGGAINDLTPAPSVGNAAIAIINVSAFSVNNVQFDRIYPGTTPSSTCIVQIINAQNTRFNNCTVTNSTSISAGIAVGSSNNYNISGNILNISPSGILVNEFGTPATNKVVANNII